MNATVTMDFKDVVDCRNHLMHARDDEFSKGDFRRLDDVVETLEQAVASEIMRHSRIISDWTQQVEGNVEVLQLLGLLEDLKKDAELGADSIRPSIDFLLDHYATVQEYEEELEQLTADAAEAASAGSAEAGRT